MTSDNRPRRALSATATFIAGRAPLSFVVGVFFLSRAIAFRKSIHFHELPFDGYWQYIDAPLLREHLWQSIFYLHSQPPFFNLFLGSVLAIAPGHTTIVFAALYKAMGLGIAVAVYGLMVRLGVGPWLAALVTVAFIVSPPAVYFENYLFYEYPTMLLLCAAAWALHRFLAEGRIRDGLIAFGLMAAVVLTRSLFQIPWFALVVAAVAAPSSRAMRRKIVIAAAAPLAVTLAFYLKNFVLFGTFTTSSWFGMNLMSEVTFQMPEATRSSLVERGIVSPLFSIRPFSNVAAYRAYLPEFPHTGIALLDDERTATGMTNHHHIVYAMVSNQYAADALRIIRDQPSLYVSGLRAAASLFFRPSSDFEYFFGFRYQLRTWQWIYHTFLYGQLTAPSPEQRETDAEARDLGALGWRIGWFILIGTPLLMVHGFSRLRVARHARDESGAGTLAFILLTISYLTVVAVGLNVGENQRYRFLLEPFLFVLLALAVQRILCVLSGSQRIHRRRR